MSILELSLHFPPVKSLESFIRARWIHLGGDGGLDGIEDAGGPTANTIRKICEQPKGRQRNSDAPDRLAIFLGFDSWLDLMDAHNDKTKGVRWRLATIKLSAPALKIAQDGARERGITLEQWVNQMIENTGQTFA